ncbi:DUF3526 domain-containing protein [Hufsiella ginkgonis]|uniref:DUF3526 domain-containing protein n=1 Tax=Hufsiella ginkgonis TaxID=2695274 RepID=A0A7K1XRW7_9SPHI|nr:DUF3526 domain-containing protein [Hufsiella ginkgonis]MXV13741.1 DUF3526 domain-containing protein [Hufsiella ginkgonis]
MDTLGLIIGHQFREWKRNRLVHGFIAILVVLWVFALYAGIVWYHSTARIREGAASQSRENWLGQERKHPHIAAHFGNFAFKHVNPLSIFDNGTDMYTGTYVYLEAHRQNDVLFSPAQSSSSLVRFGSFNIALLLQVVIPLFLFALTFNTVLAERNAGTLALMKSSGIKPATMIRGKVLAPLLLVSAALAVLSLISVILLTASSIPFGIPDLVKLGLMLLFHLLYYLVLLVIAVGVSARSRSLKQSLLALTGIWIFACVVWPKLLGNISGVLHPLPSNTLVKNAIREDILNGLDGHNTSDQRAKMLIDSFLKKYGATTTSQLPVNIEGVVMVEGEKYSSRVYREHFRRVDEILRQQQHLLSFAGILDPLLSVKNLSMAICNTDPVNDRLFRQAAEAYRMNFVQLMNTDMAEHSKENEFGIYKVGREVFDRVAPFRFRPSGPLESLSGYVVDLFCLAVLAVLSWSCIYLIARKV